MVFLQFADRLLQPEAGPIPLPGPGSRRDGPGGQQSSEEEVQDGDLAERSSGGNPELYRVF
jgi:hypothetical protein